MTSTRAWTTASPCVINAYTPQLDIWHRVCELLSLRVESRVNREALVAPSSAVACTVSSFLKTYTHKVCATAKRLLRSSWNACIDVDGLRHCREIQKIYPMPMKTPRSAKSFAKPHQTVFVARRAGPRAFCVGADLLPCNSSFASLYAGPGKNNSGWKVRCLRGLCLPARLSSTASHDCCSLQKCCELALTSPTNENSETRGVQ